MIIRKILTSMTAAAAVILSAGCEMMEVYNEEEQMALLRLNQPVTESDIPVSKLMELMQKASDPEGKYRDTEYYLLKQKTTSDNEIGEGDRHRFVSTSAVMEIRYKKPDNILWTTIQEGEPVDITLIKGKDVWKINPRTKRSKKLKEGFELDLWHNSSAMAMPTKNYLDIFKTVEIASVYEDGRRCYRLVCTSANPKIAPYVIYVDAETFLTMKLETIQYTNLGTMSVYTSTPVSYADIGGVKQANKTISKMPNGLNTTELVDFSLTPKLNESDFELPKPFTIFERLNGKGNNNDEDNDQ